MWKLYKVYSRILLCEYSLNYVGPKPDIKYYFDDIKISETQLNGYNNLPDIFTKNV